MGRGRGQFPSPWKGEALKVHAGIDLGSTTTKSVFLDEEGRVVGRGITNTRSNYDVACQVATSEAHLDLRMRLLERLLAEGGDLAVLEPLGRAIRLEHFLGDLSRLREISIAAAGEGRHAASSGEIVPVLADVFARLSEEAPGLFAPGSRSVSDFFRDLAGSQFLRLAEGLARPPRASFETLMGIFDKAILRVENEPPSFTFSAAAGSAFGRALNEPGLPASGGLKERAAAAVERAAKAAVEVVATVGTGYGRQRLPFAKEWIRSEILCHGLGAHAMFPRTSTVLDIGGQDTKAIQVDPEGIVTAFQMNDRCAAGCGRFLGYIADELNLGLHELGPLTLSARRSLPINSTCTVFAGAELRDRLAAGEKREEILAGLHRAIVLRAMSLVARAGGAREEFTFTGGVAKNQAVVKYVRELLAENYGVKAINISPDSIYTGALGAALFALRAMRQGAA